MLHILKHIKHGFYILYYDSKMSFSIKIQKSLRQALIYHGSPPYSKSPPTFTEKL